MTPTLTKQLQKLRDVASAAESFTGAVGWPVDWPQDAYYLNKEKQKCYLKSGSGYLLENATQTQHT